MRSSAGAALLDAIVVGSGPNGLAAAITLARAGRSVRVYEAQREVGGSARSAALTEPGFVHDTCSTVLALVPASPLLESLPLDQFGFHLVHPTAPFAHPLDDGTAVVLRRSVRETAASLGDDDGAAYRAMLEPFVDRSREVMEALLAPFGSNHPLLMARLGRFAIRSASALATSRFRTERARAFFAGAAAHGIVPLEFLASAGYAFGLLISAHAFGWPIARGGTQAFSNAMAAYFESLGGEIEVHAPVQSLAGLPASRAVLCDVTPRQFLGLAGDRLPPRYRRRLAGFRYGPGVFKVDWALSEPVPWRARECLEAGTIHAGGNFAEIAASEHAAWYGRVHDRPFLLVVQPTLFDASRAPVGKHVLWAYCHVPNGCTVDMTERIERQIERFAPGFRDCIIARHTMGPAQLESGNANLVGGDITGGANDLRQLFTRPVVSLDPYATPLPGVFLCSASTPPGGGVHGMCGYYAAQRALRRIGPPEGGPYRSSDSGR